MLNFLNRMDQINSSNNSHSINLRNAFTREQNKKIHKNATWNFCNIQQVLLKYRIHGDNLSLNPEMEKSDLIVRDNMLNFLTDDVELRQVIMGKFHPPKKKTFLEKIFSVKNVSNGIEKHKELCIAGLNFKIKKY